VECMNAGLSDLVEMFFTKMCHLCQSALNPAKVFVPRSTPALFFRNWKISNNMSGFKAK
jgi:hypothetical protein